MAPSLRVFAISSQDDVKPFEPLHPLICQAVFAAALSSPNVPE